MGVVRFYHLTRDPVDRALPRLLAKAVQAGLRVEVRAQSAETLEHLDHALWLGDEAQFLAHGIAGGPHDARQPILLTTEAALSAGTHCLMAVDGALVTATEAREIDRTFILFDGGDAAAMDHARAQWRALRGEGAETEYWSDESGSWQKKA